MTMRHGWGAIRWPAVLPGGQVSAGVLDPGLAAVSSLVKAAVEAELGDAWRAVTSALDCSHPLRAGSGSPIGTVLPVEPSPQVLGQVQLELPVLAVYRSGETETVDITLDYQVSRQPITIDWIAGPLDAGDMHRIGSFGTVLAKIVRTVIFLGRHSAYLSGACPFWGKFSDIKVIKQEGPGVMTLLGADNASGYWGVSLQLMADERVVYDHGGSEFEELNGYVPNGTGWAQDFVDAEVSLLIEGIED